MAVTSGNFWATWCTPCRDEMPTLERLWQGHKDRSVIVLAVSTDVDPALVAAFITRYRFTFPVGLDPRGELAKQFGARALPTTSLIERDGFLAALAFGARRWDGPASAELLQALHPVPRP